jgi:sialidase-1
MYAAKIRLSAACVAAVLQVAMALGGQGFDESLVVKRPRGEHGYRGMPGDIVPLRDGSLLMSYTLDGEGIMGIRSADGGRTWAKPFVLLAMPRPPAQGHYAHPSFLRLSNGEILFSYIYSTHPATPYYAHNYYRRSADDGKTWTDPYLMTPHPGYVLVHNGKLLALSTGRIVAMAEYKAYMPDTRDHNGFVGMAFFSDDQGHSWQASRNVVDMMPIEVQEPDAVELKDGRVMMFARTYSGFPVRAYSSDRCETWSKGEPVKELKMPYAGLPSARRIPSTGDILFIWISGQSVDKQNPKIRHRSTLTAAISTDEGKTFGHLRNIASDPDDDFGYQCITFLGNDRTVIAYHCRDGLRVARIPIRWFYDR